VPGQVAYGQQPISINLSKFLLQPPALAIKLRYNINQRLNSPGVDSASYGWNANGLYDVDPALASTAIPGFAEWMALYRNFQVISTRAHVTVVNETTEPTQVDFTWIPQIKAVNTYLPNLYGNAYSTNRSISGKSGMDRVTYDREIDMAQLSGSLTYWGSVSNYQGTILLNPQTLFQFQIGVNSIVGGVDADCYAQGYLEFCVHLSLPALLTI